jgi:UDP-glucose 4-epimerase
MGEGTVFAVTGVGSYWGTRLACRLLEEDGVKVIGIDRTAPEIEIPGLDYIPVDSRNRLLSDLLGPESITALCHLDFTISVEVDEMVSQRNVSGLSEVLTACAGAGVQRVVVMSSSAVYGAQRDNSVFIPEEATLRATNKYGYLSDLLQIEEVCADFRRQEPDVELTVLRFANIIGTNATTPMTQFLSLPSPFVLFGFDPIMQLVHENDVVDALALAMLRPSPGVFNVAAQDAMPLSRILRLARRIPTPIPHRMAYRGARLLAGKGLELQHSVPIYWDYLRYSLVADLSRMSDVLEFMPIFTAAESLREFAGRKSEGDETGADVSDEQLAQDIIERRQRQRERQSRAMGAINQE